MGRVPGALTVWQSVGDSYGSEVRVESWAGGYWVYVVKPDIHPFRMELHLDRDEAIARGREMAAWFKAGYEHARLYDT